MRGPTRESDGMGTRQGAVQKVRGVKGRQIVDNADIRYGDAEIQDMDYPGLRMEVNRVHAAELG
jgi:hypothetical protein